jgi:hypothetical protein
MFPPSNAIIRFGKTGAIIPNARKSSVTVTIINTNVARDPAIGFSEPAAPLFAAVLPACVIGVRF